MEFEGVNLFKDLPTGDQRVSHIVGIRETLETIMLNEVIVFIECNNKIIATKNFSRLIEPSEIENWINIISEAHKSTCIIRR